MCPWLKNGNRASHETIGWVNQKKTTRSMSVEMPSANANPRTTPAAKMKRTTAASNETASAARQVFRARFQPASTATRIDLPSRISSRMRSK